MQNQQETVAVQTGIKPFQRAGKAEGAGKIQSTGESPACLRNYKRTIPNPKDPIPGNDEIEDEKEYSICFGKPDYSGQKLSGGLISIREKEKITGTHSLLQKTATGFFFFCSFKYWLATDQILVDIYNIATSVQNIAI